MKFKQIYEVTRLWQVNGRWFGHSTFKVGPGQEINNPLVDGELLCLDAIDFLTS